MLENYQPLQIIPSEPSVVACLPALGELGLTWIKAIALRRWILSGRKRIGLAPTLGEFYVDHASHDSRRYGFFSARANIVLVAFLAIAAFFLVTEHRAHLIPYLGYWPLLLILACPLLHHFMHHGHGDNGGPGNTDDRDTAPHQH